MDKNSFEYRFWRLSTLALGAFFFALAIVAAFLPHKAGNSPFFVPGVILIVGFVIVPVAAVSEYMAAARTYKKRISTSEPGKLFDPITAWLIRFIQRLKSGATRR